MDDAEEEAELLADSETEEVTDVECVELRVVLAE